MDIKKEEFIENFYKTKTNKELAVIYGIPEITAIKLARSLHLKRKPGRKDINVRLI